MRQEVLAVCLVGVLAGCGSSSTPKGSDIDQIQAVMKRASAAYASHDWTTVCDTLSVRLRAQIVVGSALYSNGAKTCPDAMEAVAPVASAQHLPPAATDVRVAGDKATGIDPTAKASDRVLHFVRESGEWRLAS